MSEDDVLRNIERQVEDHEAALERSGAAYFLPPTIEVTAGERLMPGQAVYVGPGGVAYLVHESDREANAAVTAAEQRSGQ